MRDMKKKTICLKSISKWNMFINMILQLYNDSIFVKEMDNLQNRYLIDKNQTFLKHSIV